MGIVALMKIRNEELILKDSVEHMLRFADEVFVFDDESTDGSREILEEHPAVTVVARKYSVENHVVRHEKFQGIQRELLVRKAIEKTRAKWFVYFDADERLENPRRLKNRFPLYDEVGIYGLNFHLLDGYATEDHCEEYDGGKLDKLDRMWGIERRDIVYMFERSRFKRMACREAIIRGSANKIIVDEHWIKHYGKCISQKQWDDKVEFYMRYGNQNFTKKWAARRGGYIHEESDFGTELLRWSAAKKKSVNIHPLGATRNPSPVFMKKWKNYLRSKGLK